MKPTSRATREDLSNLPQFAPRCRRVSRHVNILQRCSTSHPCISHAVWLQGLSLLQMSVSHSNQHSVSPPRQILTGTRGTHVGRVLQNSKPKWKSTPSTSETGLYTSKSHQATTIVSDHLHSPPHAHVKDGSAETSLCGHPQCGKSMLTAPGLQKANLQAVAHSVLYALPGSPRWSITCLQEPRHELTGLRGMAPYSTSNSPPFSELSMMSISQVPQIDFDFRGRSCGPVFVDLAHAAWQQPVEQHHTLQAGVAHLWFAKEKGVNLTDCRKKILH